MQTWAWVGYLIFYANLLPPHSLSLSLSHPRSPDLRISFLRSAYPYRPYLRRMRKHHHCGPFFRVLPTRCMLISATPCSRGRDTAPDVTFSVLQYVFDHTSGLGICSYLGHTHVIL